MGLLDDAIREHLELKRRHGADPQEVARQEDEVLGHEPHDELEEPDPLEHSVHEDQLALEEPHAPEHEPERADAPQPPAEPAFDVQQPTVEFSVEDAHTEEEPRAEEAAQEDAEPADELEETPEFLQETPEHDRLWFEQKPPRDFDF